MAATEVHIDVEELKRAVGMSIKPPSPGLVLERVTIDFQQVMVGYGPNERTEKVLKGATLVFKPADHSGIYDE